MSHPINMNLYITLKGIVSHFEKYTQDKKHGVSPLVALQLLRIIFLIQLSTRKQISASPCLKLIDTKGNIIIKQLI